MSHPPPAGGERPAGPREETAGPREQPAGPREETAGPRGPLSGLLVADFARVLAGPYATMLLADLGADVIKVESPAGDDTRGWMPPDRDGVSTYYLAVNRNKRSVALDLKDPAGLTAARELARRADVLVENFRPGVMDALGLGYAAVRTANPSVIYASISGFGTGEGAALPGYDLLAQAMSGLMSLTGDPDGPPLRSGISLVDVLAGLHAAIGILAALHHRGATGTGQRIEVNLLSSALSGMVNQASAYAAGGVVPFRMGNKHPSVYPYEPLPAGDGDLIVAVGNDAQFARLCEVLGIPGLASDPRFARNSGRTARRDELRPLLAEQLKRHPARHWFRELMAAGVPCGPINTLDAGIADAARLGLSPIVDAGRGEAAVPTIRNPIGFSRTPPRYDLPPPGLDEHGAAIRAWLAAPGSG